MDSFQHRLRACLDSALSPLVVGLDPVLERLPDGIERTPRGVVEFNRQIIRATRDYVAGYKLNFAFYEALGPDGWDVLADTRSEIDERHLSVADAKRGDIGSTSEQYARSIFDVLGFDAVTVTPYVGHEGLAPFCDRKSRGVFVVCRTTNRDAFIQDARLEDGLIYERVARTAPTWGDNVGLVVGATDVIALKRVRELAPSAPILMPGLGAQGGDVQRSIAASASGSAPVIPAASRSIIYASSSEEFAVAAGVAARDLSQKVALAASPVSLPG